MADATADMDADHAASLGRRYLIKFEGPGSSIITPAAGRSAGPPR